MASRSVLMLALPVREAALRLVDMCSHAGIDLLIYGTVRSRQEQAALYAQGRTQPGPIVTTAKPGESLHNPDSAGLAWAFDAVPLVCGKAAWDDHDLLVQVGAIAADIGLEWAGNWTGKLREYVHFQIKPGENK